MGCITVYGDQWMAELGTWSLFFAKKKKEISSNSHLVIHWYAARQSWICFYQDTLGRNQCSWHCNISPGSPQHDRDFPSRQPFDQIARFRFLWDEKHLKRLLGIQQTGDHWWVSTEQLYVVNFKCNVCSSVKPNIQVTFKLFQICIHWYKSHPNATAKQQSNQSETL